jgi:hypothetical protein
MADLERRTSPLAVAAAWVIVTIPLGWGVYQCVVKSLPLFRPSAPSAARVSPPPK